MRMKLNENNYSYYIYRNLICLAILLHIVYTMLMGCLHYGIPLFYNICSVFDSSGNDLLCCIAHRAVWMAFFVLSLSDCNGISCVFLSLSQSLYPLSVFHPAYAHLLFAVCSKQGNDCLSPACCFLTAFISMQQLWGVSHHPLCRLCFQCQCRYWQGGFEKAE